MARELEVATRHNQLMTKFEAWAAATFGGKDGKPGSEAAATAGERLCKYPHCFDHGGPTIHSASPSVKWVYVRCSDGCASSFHQACWHVVEADIEPDDAATAPEEAAVGPRCVHSRDRKCKGRIVRVDLKQNGKVNSSALASVTTRLPTHISRSLLHCPRVLPCLYLGVESSSRALRR